jgi:hypothetical protein
MYGMHLYPPVYLYRHWWGEEPGISLPPPRFLEKKIKVEEKEV